MKKLISALLVGVMALSIFAIGASAMTLEERIEALHTDVREMLTLSDEETLPRGFLIIDGNIHDRYGYLMFELDEDGRKADGTLVSPTLHIRYGSDYLGFDDDMRWYGDITMGDITASTASEVSVTINGVVQVFEVAPQLINGRTMVPLRAIAEALGMVVDFEGETNTAILTIEGIQVVHTIGSHEISVNGEASTFDMTSMIIENRTLMPVRMLAEAIGADVGWDADTGTVVITK